jgi:hypothetical protein
VSVRVVEFTMAQVACNSRRPLNPQAQFFSGPPTAASSRRRVNCVCAKDRCASILMTATADVAPAQPLNRRNKQQGASHTSEHTQRLLRLHCAPYAVCYVS